MTQNPKVNAINKKPYREGFVTPKGTARFPALLIPDTKFSADGEYHVGLVVDPVDPDVSTILDKINELTDEWYSAVYNVLPMKDKDKASKHISVEDEYDQNDEPTGKVILKFRQKPFFKRKDGTRQDLQPPLFDAAKKPWPEGKDVNHNALIKVSFLTHPYYVPSTGMCGLKLRIRGVQVIDNNAVTPDSLGFNDETEGSNVGSSVGSDYESPEMNDEEGDDIPF